MTMITPSYLGETIEYSSLHACRSTLEDPTQNHRVIRNDVDPKLLTVALLNLLNWTIFWFEPGGGLQADDLGEVLAKIYLQGILIATP